jgi:hypothetical protein
MFENRFRDFFNPHESFVSVAIPANVSGFVAVPCPAFTMWPIQQAQTDYLYRLAFEQAQAQVTRPFVTRIPAFSRN